MKRVAIGSDHAGFETKQDLVRRLIEADYEVVDVGTDSTESVDFPDFAAAVGKAVLDELVDRGIVVCGTGVGAAIASNKIKGIRSAQATDTYTAQQAVEHNDVNVLAIGGKLVDDQLAWEMVDTFLHSEFTGEERFVRRVRKIADLESG